MKCTFKDNNILIYIQDTNITEKSFDDLVYIEEYFKSIFVKIKEKYNININGLYIVNVYFDNQLGMVLELKEEKIDFIDYDDVVDMKIILHNEHFLYEIDDILNLKDNDIYLYQKKWYVRPKNIYHLLEHARIIYKNTEKIVRYGKKI